MNTSQTVYFDYTPKPQMLRRYFDSSTKSAAMQIEPEQYDTFWEQIRTQVCALPGVTLSKYASHYTYSEKANRTRTLAISLGEGEQHRYLEQIHLRINDANQIEVNPHNDWYPLTSLKQLTDYIVAYQAEAQTQYLQALKKQKVRELKITTLTAPLKKLAKQRRLMIGFEETSHRLRVHILLSENEDLTLSIPFRNYQAIAPKLVAMVENLLELKALGLSIKQQNPRYQHAEVQWFSPDEL